MQRNGKHMFDYDRSRGGKIDQQRWRWLVRGLVASSPAAASLTGTASNRQTTRSVAAERAQFPGKVGVRDASGYPKYCDSESARHGITIMRKIE